jgi:hypothetical protein
MIPSALAGVNISTEAHVMINIAITNLIFIKPAFQLTIFTNEIFILYRKTLTRIEKFQWYNSGEKSDENTLHQQIELEK